MPAGRPTKFKPDYVEQAKKLCSIKAFTDFELAQFFGVNRDTIYEWQVAHPEFRDAIVTGKQEPDDRVERSLYERALGYSVRAEKVFNDKGTIVRAEVVEHYPPDTTAAIFWLKNRRPKDWRDKQDVEHSGNLGITRIERKIVNSGNTDS